METLRVLLRPPWSLSHTLTHSSLTHALSVTHNFTLSLSHLESFVEATLVEGVEAQLVNRLRGDRWSVR